MCGRKGSIALFCDSKGPRQCAAAFGLIAFVAMVRCAFSDRILHSRMPLDPTHVRWKRSCV
jgi:hypothetical protein